MATTGKPGRPVTWRLAAAVLALGGLAGCSGGGPPVVHPSPSSAAAAGREPAGKPGADARRGARRAGRSRHRPAGPDAGRTGAPGGQAGPAAWSRFCPRPPSRALRAELARTVPLSARTEVVPLGMARSGAVAYVAAWTAGFSGVAALDLASGRLRPVRAFPDPVTDQADGAAAGNWLVWEETHSLQSLDGFTVYAWNAATGRLLRLGHSQTGPGGRPWPSPWHAPAVAGHYAAWAEGSGPGGQIELRLADLATGRVRVVATGRLQPPFFDASLLVWPQAGQPGGLTRLRALRLPAARPAALPPVLRGVRGTDFVVTDGTRTGYLSPDLTRLYYSASPGRPARVALRLPAGVEFTGLALGPGTLAWTTTRATYLASTRTGSYARVTPSYGAAVGTAAGVVVSDPPGSKALHPVIPMHVLGPAAAPLGRCGQAPG